MLTSGAGSNSGESTLYVLKFPKLLGFFQTKNINIK